MCLLFCFVLFWIFCYVVCEKIKIKIVDNKKKKKPRDANQVMVLGKQMFPSNVKYFMECYQDATSQPYGYLMIDYKAKTPEQYRLRTGLLSDRQVIYIQKRRA